MLLFLSLLLVLSVATPSTGFEGLPNQNCPKYFSKRRLGAASPSSTDLISADSFHHIEFYCGDASTTYNRFMLALGMELTAKSDLSTGNTKHASYVLQSGDVHMVFTAPYLTPAAAEHSTPVTSLPLPHFDSDVAAAFFAKHGLGVRAIGVSVADVRVAFDAMVLNGATPRLVPTRVVDSEDAETYMDTAEVELYGDVLLRLVSSEHCSRQKAFLPNFRSAGRKGETLQNGRFGLKKFDHIVGNLWSLEPAVAKLKRMLGFHEFAEFVAGDVGTVDSGLNSVVLASERESVLLPLNEPTFGTKRKSQIQTYLEQNNGEGVQHIALYTPDIFATLRHMRAAAEVGGFELQQRPAPSYYTGARQRVGASLSEQQYAQCEELGVLADKDDAEGVLLQVFTKPVGDRPTLFLEIIQRIGCVDAAGEQRPGCGGFGKGNFRDLFKSIEDFEKTLKI